jgi:hypothetical protein
MVVYYVLSFFSGILVKLVDNIEDEVKKQKFLKYGKFPIALAYGITIGFLISKADFSMLFLGALIAQLAAGKIDAPAHKLGFAAALLTPFAFGLPQFDFLPLIVFIAAAYIDEMKLKGMLKTFAEYRLFLKIAALAFIAIGRIDYLLAILVFDIGYMLTAKS